ncbi:MAG: hypothetical protein OHK0015_34070 [Chloroflexi bacterium OHK40]
MSGGFEVIGVSAFTKSQYIGKSAITEVTTSTTHPVQGSLLRLPPARRLIDATAIRAPLLHTCPATRLPHATGPNAPPEGP